MLSYHTRLCFQHRSCNAGRGFDFWAIFVEKLAENRILAPYEDLLFWKITLAWMSAFSLTFKKKHLLFEFEKLPELWPPHFKGFILYGKEHFSIFKKFLIFLKIEEFTKLWSLLSSPSNDRTPHAIDDIRERGSLYLNCHTSRRFWPL